MWRVFVPNRSGVFTRLTIELLILLKKGMTSYTFKVIAKLVLDFYLKSVNPLPEGIEFLQINVKALNIFH